MPDGHQPTTVDDVPVHHFPAPAGTDDDVSTAELIFGVGGRDEGVPDRGALHAIEHLVMDRVRRTPIEINASVGASSTEFVAAGDPPAVAEFVRGVCRALSDLPTDRWPIEAKVLAVEAAGADPDAAGVLRRTRYGHRDLGVVDAPLPRPSGLTTATLRSYADRFFHRANAQLVLTGPWPADLTLPLPTGPVPTRGWPAARPLGGPAAILVEGPACALSLVLPALDAAALPMVLAELVTARLREALRHERGLAYQVEGRWELVDGGRLDLVVEADPLPPSIQEAVHVLIAATQALLRRGPAAEELAQAVARTRHSYRGREATIESTRVRASAALRGVTVPPFDPAALDALSADAVGSALRGLEAELLVLADLAAEREVREAGLAVVETGPILSRPPAGRSFRPPLGARAVNAEARHSVAVLSDDGIGLLAPPGPQRVRFDDVAGVVREESGDVIVLGADGTGFPVGPFRYRGGRALVDALSQRVPPGLFFDSDDLDPGPPD